MADRRWSKGNAVTLLPTPEMTASTFGVDVPLQLTLSRFILTGMPRGVPNHHLGDYKRNQVDSEEEPPQCISVWQAVL